jgi:hypothetical protein
MSAPSRESSPYPGLVGFLGIFWGLSERFWPPVRSPDKALNLPFGGVGYLMAYAFFFFFSFVCLTLCCAPAFDRHPTSKSTMLQFIRYKHRQICCSAGPKITLNSASDSTRAAAEGKTLPPGAACSNNRIALHHVHRSALDPQARAASGAGIVYLEKNREGRGRGRNFMMQEKRRKNFRDNLMSVYQNRARGLKR